jgi:hypothetical protein
VRGDNDSSRLIDATRKGPMPPPSPPPPWHRYAMGIWSKAWEEAADRIVIGAYAENGALTAKRRRKDVRPATPVEDPDR